MASWDPSATQSVNSLIAGSGITLSPASGQGVVTISSSGGGGGVSALVAGSNVTLSPTSGLGTVTINSAGGWVSTATSLLDMSNFTQSNVNSFYGVNLTPLSSLIPLYNQSAATVWGAICPIINTNSFMGLQANQTTAGYICSIASNGRVTVRTAPGRRLWSGITATFSTSFYACVYGGQIYRSTNGGGSWTATAGSSSLNWTGVWGSYQDALTCVACVSGGGIYKTANGGTTWTAMGAPSVAWSGISCASGIADTVAYTGTQIYYCQDPTGATWNLVANIPTLPAGVTFSSIAMKAYDTDIFFVTTSAGVAYQVYISSGLWNTLDAPGTCVGITPGYQNNGVVLGNSNTGTIFASLVNGNIGTYFYANSITSGAWSSVAINSLQPTPSLPTPNYTYIAGVLGNSSNAYIAPANAISIQSAYNVALSASNVVSLSGSTGTFNTLYGLLLRNTVSSAITLNSPYGSNTPINLQNNYIQYSSPANSNVFVRQPLCQFGTATGASGVSGTQIVTLPTAYTSQTSFVPTVTMADSPAAQVFASTITLSSFMLGWTSGGSGSHSFYWTTMGN